MLLLFLKGNLEFRNSSAAGEFLSDTVTGIKSHPLCMAWISSTANHKSSSSWDVLLDLAASLGTKTGAQKLPSIVNNTSCLGVSALICAWGLKHAQDLKGWSEGTRVLLKISIGQTAYSHQWHIQIWSKTQSQMEIFLGVKLSVPFHSKKECYTSYDDDCTSM